MNITSFLKKLVCFNFTENFNFGMKLVGREIDNSVNLLNYQLHFVFDQILC